MIRIKRNPRNEKIINDLIIKRRRIRSEPPVFHELYSYDIYYQNEKIGYVWVNKTNSWVNKVEILYPEYRRQGINSYVYDYIEKDLNIKLKPSGNLSSDGAAFWQNRLKKQNPTDKQFLSQVKIRKVLNKEYISYEAFYNNKYIAGVDFDPKTKTIWDVWVGPNYRRKGLATFIYNKIEKDQKIKLKPSDTLFPDGQEFWKARLKTG